MYEFTYNFDFANAQVAGRDRDGGAKFESPDEEPRSAKLHKTWKTLTGTLAIPVNDCLRRSHPRIVPDYSLLVLISCVTNPVLGALACYLHRQAKHFSHKGKTFRADVLYLTVMAVSLIGIGSTLLGVSLVTSYHLIHHFARQNVQRAKPHADCLFRHHDDVRRKMLNLSRNDYCRLLKALRGKSGYWFTNASKVIDKTAG